MVLNFTDSKVRNPLTPLAFVPPDFAYQMTISAYVMIGSVSALIWDILIHVDSDFKLLFRHKIGVPTVVYFLSRASVLAWGLLNVFFAVAALPDCQAIISAICIVYHIAFSSTAFLFFLRVRAFFIQNKLIVAFFAILWLGVLGTSLSLIESSNAAHLGPTDYCIYSKLKPYAVAAPVTFAANDTFVFLAISWRLWSNRIVDRESKLNIKSMILGDYLPAFSRALLQDGQVYYLVSLSSNIAVAIISYDGKVPVPYHPMLMVFNVMLTNMMACRVFRKTKLGNYRDDTFYGRRSVSHPDLEGGEGEGRNVRSQIRFVSFHSTQTGTHTEKSDTG